MKKAKLKILFDANPLMGNRTGIGHYTDRLIQHIADQYPEIHLTGYYYNFLGRKAAPTTPVANNISYRPIHWFPGALINLLRRKLHIEIPVELLTLTRADFLLFPNFLCHPSLFHTPSASVIHDLTFHDYPSLGSDKNIRDLQTFIPKIIAQSDFIITVSQFSKQRIAEVYNIPADSIVTTFIPPSKVLKIDESRQLQLLGDKGITKPYLLFLGTMEPRKNVGALLEAYTLLPARLRQAYSLVLVGKIDWKYQETMARIEQLQADSYDIRYLGYVDDEARAALYQGASLFVLPSVYEGFGMQIAEALSYGLPCAVSDIPVFHEVGGSAVTYFDHLDPRKIAVVLQQSLENKVDTTKLIHQLDTYPTWPTIVTKLVTRIQKEIMKGR